MVLNSGPSNISDILKNKRQQIKPPAYQWQDLALRVIRELGIPQFKRNAVFRVCKKYSKTVIEKGINDTKELCQTGERWKYFFKIVDGSDKPTEIEEKNQE